MSEARRVLGDFPRFPMALAGTTSFLETDGYLTAIVVGPNLILPSELLVDLWPEEPVINSAEEAELVIGTLINRYDGIIRQLDGRPENYRPLYLPENPAQPATVERASAWSQGFWRAIMRIPGWRRQIEDRDARCLLVPILAFAKNPEGEVLFGHTRAELEDILKDSVDNVAECILRIREYHRETASSHDRRHRSQRPGRNDPCPCGSGKKYKRCCGAT